MKMNCFTRYRKRLLLPILLSFCFTILANEDRSVSKTLKVDIQEQYVVINGRILGEANDVLPGASVIIRSLGIGSSSDWDGLFTLSRVPVGTHIIEISYLGFDTLTKEVEVTVGSTSEINLGNIKLQPSTNELGEVIVTGSIEGQQKAYNLQRSSDNIKTVVSADLINRFPDINVAEAMQRVSGVSIERDGGEGSIVKIRGTPQNFTTISINGEQIPPTDEEGARSESLDLVSADQLASMEVSKAITPEMDGDAIGGAINLITPTARGEKAQFRTTVGGGYNNLFDKGSTTLKFRYDQRFADNKFGVLFGTSYYNTNNGDERYQATYRFRRIGDSDDPNSFEDWVIDDFRLRPVQRERDRIGANATVDYKFSTTSKVFVKLIYSKLDDRTLRRRIRFRPRNNYDDPLNPGVANNIEVRRDVNDKVVDRENITFSFGGDHALGSLAKLDYGVTYTTSQRELNSFRYTFRQRGLTVDFDRSGGDFPRISALNGDLEDDSAFDFSFLQRDIPIVNKGNNTTANLNLSFPIQLGNKQGEIKVGGKYRGIENIRRRTLVQYGFNGDYTLDQVSDGFSETIFDDTYEMGSFPDANLSNQHFIDNFGDYEINERITRSNSDRFFYNANEDVLATYIQGKMQFNKLRVLAGVRYESTEVDYDALGVVEGGNEPSIPVQGDSDYDFVLPMIHLKYAFTDRTNFRLSYTESFARPDLQDLVPRQNLSFENLVISTGNPELKPASAQNVDLLFEHYFKSDGIISGGLFYKRIEDFIFDQVTDIDDPGNQFDGWRQTKPVNGDEANLYGVEVNVAKKFTFLPGVLSGLGVNLNYTYVQSDSSFEFFNDDTGETNAREDVPFIGQADNLWNAALYYDKGGFTGRVSLNYNGKSLLSFTDQPDLDFFVEERYQMDVNVSQKIMKGLTVFAEFVNLLDEPAIEYQGIRSRVTNYESYGWFSRFGINYNF